MNRLRILMLLSRFHWPCCFFGLARHSSLFLSAAACFTLFVMNIEQLGISNEDFDTDSSLEELEVRNDTRDAVELDEIESHRKRHAEQDVLSANLRPAFHLNNDKLHTYIYPTNLERRDYQENIVRKALKQNVLCALPTGLGKTFIASTVMLNFYRWTTDAKVIFMAPTRPLVSQQIDACLGITGIPRHDSTVMIGTRWTAAQRESEWNEKRVIFATPQIVENDLKKGLLDLNMVCCIVVDEAHRATGNYAYVEVIKTITKNNKFVRILALTATPSGSLEGVQDVINNLMINSCELRTEESIDTRQYVHKREIKKILVEDTNELSEILTLFKKSMEPMLQELNKAGGLRYADVDKISQFGLVNASKQYSQSPAARSKSPITFRIRALYGLMIKLAHALGLLKFHGVKPFYDYAKDIKDAGYAKKGGPGKILGAYLDLVDFQKCMELSEKSLNDKKFFGHGKLIKTVEIINDFFGQQSDPDESRAIVFVDYRESAQELTRVIKEQCSAFGKAHLFIGQSSSKSGRTEGMKQKEQQEVIDKFRKGSYNILIATSIGEEGLDIGQVDLIILYDQSKSPIRSVQRMGRTGRKRNGAVYMLMTENEETKAQYAMKGYKYIQDQINKKLHFEFIAQEEKNQLLPSNLTCIYENIEIPHENVEIITEADEDSVERLVCSAKKTKKRPLLKDQKNTLKRQKVFKLPENVELGFISASSLMTENIEPNN